MKPVALFLTETLQAISFATFMQITVTGRCRGCAKLHYAAPSLSIHHNGGYISVRLGEGATRNFEFAEFTRKDSDFEWRSSILFLGGGWKIPTVSNAAFLCARATVTRESCQSQITDRLLHRGTDILDCSSVYVT